MKEPDPQAPEELERAILGQAPVFNAPEVAEQTGVSIDEARRLFSSLANDASLPADLRAASLYFHGRLEQSHARPVNPQAANALYDRAQAEFPATEYAERAFVMQDLRLARVVRVRARAHSRAPQRFQILDVVAVEQRQRRIALVQDVAAVRDPVFGRMRRELPRVERRRDRDPARLGLLCIENRSRQCGKGRANDGNPERSHSRPP